MKISSWDMCTEHIEKLIFFFLRDIWGCAAVVIDTIWGHAGGPLRDQHLAWLGWEEQKKGNSRKGAVPT